MYLKRFLIACLIFYIPYSLSIVFTHLEEPKVDLPEEYPLITKADKLRGYIDNNNVLHITFDNRANHNNGIEFIWNDDEESIPPDGSLITLEQTDENTVYIGPYDPKAKIN